MNYDDETLMAYADGELDEAQRATISEALEKDPELARRVQRHRALRAEVAGAFAAVMHQPVPEKLLAAARGSAAPLEKPAPPRAEVLPFPARSSPPPARRWGVPQWSAMAASLVLGVFISWQFFAPPGSMMTASHGALVARGALAKALDQQLASTQTATDAVQIGISFRSGDGGYCRSFNLVDAGTAGLACFASGEWRIALTAASPASAGGLRPAASPPEVLQAIEARISGEPLDAGGEQQARGNGWRTAPP